MRNSRKYINQIEQMDENEKSIVFILSSFLEQYNQEIMSAFKVDKKQLDRILDGELHAEVKISDRNNQTKYSQKLSKRLYIKIGAILVIAIILFTSGFAFAGLYQNNLNIFNQGDSVRISDYVNADDLDGYIVPLRYPSSYTLTNILPTDFGIQLDFAQERSGRTVVYRYFTGDSSVTSVHDIESSSQRLTIANEDVLYVALQDDIYQAYILENDSILYEIIGPFSMDDLTIFIENVGLYQISNTGE